jgi:hypothetical protein
VYNAESRIHDALVPFVDLGEDDRGIVLEIVEVLELEAQLASAVDYPRGADRRFTVREMRTGLDVASAIGPARGKVISWETSQRTGRLQLIRVKWDDGRITEHAPAERELRRVEP